MKAQVLYKGGQPFVLEDRPDPEPGPGEAVAKVSGLWRGSDDPSYSRGSRARLTSPSSLATRSRVKSSRSESRASRDSDLKVGDPVTAYFYLIEGEDKWTRAGRAPISTANRGYVGRQIDGGYAEFIKLAGRQLHQAPRRSRLQEQACGRRRDFADAIATPYKVLPTGAGHPNGYGRRVWCRRRSWACIR